MQPFEALSYRGQARRLAELAREALAVYALPPARLRLLRHETNTTFRADMPDDRRYVLRIHRPDGHSLPAVRSEMLWLQALCREPDLHVPEPVPAHDGTLVREVEVPGVPGPRLCVVFRWIEGRFFGEGLTPAHLEQVGALTARLHLFSAGWQPPTDFTRSRVDTLSAAARRSSPLSPDAVAADAANDHPSAADVAQAVGLVAATCAPEDRVTVEAALDRIRAVLRELGYAPDAFGLIHGDLHQENYCFHGGTVRAIDFDDCGYGHYLYDLGVTLIELQQLPRYEELRAALLAGYRRLRPLPMAHEHYLEVFFALRRLQLLMWVLESREHPAFRDEWIPWSRDLLAGVERFLATL
jgi:Ser/Thr protein kinase RdoA (MazF antagonist)